MSDILWGDRELARIWRPRTDSQSAALTCNVPFMLMGGCAGAYKSENLMIRPLRFRHRPLAKSIIFRRTSPELEQLIGRAKQIYFQLGATYRGDPVRIFTFPSGATVKFDFMEREDHEDRQYSNEYDFIGFDESTRMKMGMKLIRFMFARNRSKDPFLQQYCQVMLATNPGGPGNNDHKHVFIGSCCYHCSFGDDVSRVPGKIYYDATWPEDKQPIGKATVFIPGKLDEAGLLGQVYAENLRTLRADQRKALLAGCWEITEGMFFDCWDERKMVVKRQLVGDQWWWPHWVSIDYGFAGSCASSHLHCKGPATAEFPEGRNYTIAEIVEQRMLAEDFAKNVFSTWCVNNRRIVAWYGGPDLWNRTGDGHQRSDQMMKATGMPLEQASTDREGGAMLMYTQLNSGLWVIADTCEMAIKSLPTRMHDDDNPDDVMKVKGDPLDDVYDDLRYGMYSYIGQAVKPASVRIAEAVTSSDPTGRAMQAQQAHAQIAREDAPISYRSRWRGGRGD